MPGEGPSLWLGAACKARTETAYKAEGCEASWHMTAKPTGTQPTVNAALMGKGPQPLRRTDSSRPYLGRSAPRAVRVEGGMTRTVQPGYQEPGAAASCPPRAMNRQQPPSTPQRELRQRNS